MGRTTKGGAGDLPVTSLKHKDRRKNIPTEELRGFVEEDEKRPRTLLYKRDSSLDPQLVWKGKDEQDAKDLGVPVLPVYIQEKIHPHALIEALRAEARSGAQGQISLFADFNGIKFEELIEFYRHEQNWANRMILGDSLLVMTSLAEKEGLKGKVQMVYMDPPYGIKFGSNWQVSTRKRDVKDGKVEDTTRQPEQIRAFRDTWQLGIHSYLAYLRDRLVAARELLTETGSIFVQIGDDNVHLVRSVLDEVFGSEGFCGLITISKTAGQTTELLPGVCDYLVWYAKNRDMVKFRRILRKKDAGDDAAGVYRWIELEDGVRRRMTSEEVDQPTALPSWHRIFRLDNITSQSMGREKGEGAASWFAVSIEGQEVRPSIKSRWKTNETGMRRLLAARRVVRSGDSLAYIRFLDDFRAMELGNLWTDTGTGSFTDPKLYVVQTGTKVVERCLQMTTDPGDLVLDPTCGGGTTAHVAEEWGRRWITIDTSRVALALARTRLMAARHPYYLLADSPEGKAKEQQVTGVRRPDAPTTSDVRRGFVNERVPHITLKSIAHNEEIDEIHARWQEKLEPVRAELNKLLHKRLQEWEVPREPEKEWPKGAKALLDEWWKLRQRLQKEIDESIARRAETELLHNLPYGDPKRIRVTGPFTVESLSPHRVLSADEERPAKEREAQATSGAGQFVTTILDYLRRSPVRTTQRDERLVFERVEPFAGDWIQGVGEYTDASGKLRRVAIAVGPEHGTVGPEQVKEAAKEAMRGVGFDLLIVCGFAFDAHAGETAKEISPETAKVGGGIAAEETRHYGKLRVLLARMNPDLAMGDELLKKTGAGNLFMVFGEPDIAIKRQKDGLVVEIKGVDVYDPTTGAVRDHSTDDIACWFIDTDYNGESFFVRQAYFTGAQKDRPYDKLKRALRAEIDEEAWEALYSTISRPFPAPKSGKIAVKVINHYGDEVLKVYPVK